MQTRGHIGNGQIYLDPREGWVNVDTPDSGAALADDKPQFVEKWKTTEARYYERVDAARQGISVWEDRILHPRGNPVLTDRVTDRYGSWERLPFADGEMDELYSVQTFEHLSHRESKQAMEEARRVLKTYGVLRLDVPDHDEAFALLKQLWSTGNDGDARFMMSHIMGSANNDTWAYHLGSWTRHRLRKFVECYGFRFIHEEKHPHSYPAFCLRWEKIPYDRDKHHPVHNLYEPRNRWRAAYAYAGNPLGMPLTVPDSFRVLEVGPGTTEWPRANAFCDIVPRELPNFSIGDLNKRLPYRDGEFDYVISSHVMEHVEDPVHSASELSRVAKAGVVICPSVFKEGLFAFHEQDHRWHVHPAGKNGAMRFLPVPDWVEKAYDPNMCSVLHNLLVSPCLALREYGDIAKQWLDTHEPKIDVVHHWNGELKVEVHRDKWK